MQRAYRTLKQNLVKFLTTLTLLTKQLKHLDQIKWHRNCANLWLLSRQIEDVVISKETSKISKRSPIIFCRFSPKKWNLAGTFSLLLNCAKVGLRLSSWWFKCYYSQKNSLTEKIVSVPDRENSQWKYSSKKFVHHKSEC